MFNPFEQFLVTSYTIIEKEWSNMFSLLNHTIYVNDTILITIYFILLNYLVYTFISFEKKKISKSALKLLLIEIYKFVYDIVKLYLAPKGNKYFPFLLYLFIFIVYCNITGILPYAFTITSHLSITITLAFIVWYGNLIIGFVKNGLYYFQLIFPLGVPFVLTPFIVGVEGVSYNFRPVSLGSRLFANIVAGHILLDTLALFMHNMVFPDTFSLITLLLFIIPFFLCIILIMFEGVVAILQAYIFLTLAAIYLKDAYTAQIAH